MGEITVRVLVEEEWEVLRNLRIRALTDSPDAFSPTVEEARGRPDRSWIDFMRTWTRDGGRIFVAFDGEHSLGLVSAIGDESGTGQVGAMWVDPGVRGSGTGRRLLEEACAALAACPRIELTVTEGNARAQKLYETAGFELTGNWEPLRESSPLRNLEMARGGSA